MGINDIYKKIIMDHYRNPRNLQKMEQPSTCSSQENTLCGDKVTIMLFIRNTIIEKCTFQGDGCAISLASASITTEFFTGKSLEYTLDAVTDILSVTEKEMPSETLDNYEDIAVFKDIAEHSTRIKCACVAWRALKKAIELY